MINDSQRSAVDPADKQPIETLILESETAVTTLSPGYIFLKQFRRHRLALLGIATITLLALMAILAPVISPYDPNVINMAQSLVAPSSEHWLGTDSIGRDIFSRLIFGARVSLSVGFIAVSIQLVIGTLLGLISGFYGGIADQLIMRLVDLVMAFPNLLLILVAVFLLGPGLRNVMLILGLLGWAGTCRLVRGQILSLREQEFLLAAESIGAKPTRIMIHHMLPNVTGLLIVTGTFGLANAIIAEAGLSFLGLGVRPPTASWGSMLQAAQEMSFITLRPWTWIPPGILISLTVLAINFIGDGLRDALDPRYISR